MHWATLINIHTNRLGIAQGGLDQRRSIVLDLNFHLPLPGLRFWSVGVGFNGGIFFF